ncbi:MAG: hypothetical protein QXZ43_00455 [Candidatus Aenigmatarchaeota archaeon]
MKLIKLIPFFPYLIFLGMLIYILFFYQEKSSSSFLSGKAMGIAGVLMMAFYYTIFLVAIFLIIKLTRFLINKIRKP